MIAQPAYAERRQRIAQASHLAGEQVVREGKIDAALMDTVSDAEISQVKFQENANDFWGTLDGKAAYLKDAPKLEYASVLADQSAG
jgi:hypothetical protein